MTLRTILLKGMLWSLGFAAVTGVLAVLIQGGDLVWRVVGTGFTTALACGVMLSISRLIDREKTRPACLLGMTAVLLEFLMAMMLIWDVPRFLMGKSWEEEIASTMMSFALGTVFAALFLRLRVERYGYYAGRVGFIVTLATFVVFMAGTWIPNGFYIRVSCRGTGVALGLFGGLAVLALVGLGTGDPRHWRWAGVAASVLTCGMWLIEIWTGVSSDPGFVVFCVLLSLTVVIAHANLSMVCPLTKRQHWVRAGTISAAILTAVSIDIVIAGEKLLRFGLDEVIYGMDEVLGRVAAAAGIVAGCGTLALCVLARINRKVDYEQLSPELTEMVVLCPRCGKKQSVSFGGAVCAVCKLRISIRIEEPRCPTCDYLLYGLVSDRCPECGTLIGINAPARE